MQMGDTLEILKMKLDIHVCLPTGSNSFKVISHALQRTFLYIKYDIC